MRLTLALRGALRCSRPTASAGRITVHHKASMFAAVLLAGCASTGTSGFSKGDHWTFPLVGPLEDGQLVTPATVRGHGPYLFLIDPDANLTVIDKQIVDEAQLLMGRGPTRIDETGAE